MNFLDHKRLTSMALACLALMATCPALAASPLDIVMSTPAAGSDKSETWEERRARAVSIDAAIGFASVVDLTGDDEWLRPHTSSIQIQAALLALGQHESGWARYVGADQCDRGAPDARCDPDKNGKARALGYWQLHRSICKEAWGSDPGPERLLTEATCAARFYVHMLKRCKGRNDSGTIAGGLAGYRGQCNTTDDTLRLKTYEVFLSVLETGWPQKPAGWARDSDPLVKHRRAAQRLKGEVGTWHELAPGVGALVEWHFHPFGGATRPRGWHRGVSLFVEVE